MEVSARSPFGALTLSPARTHSSSLPPAHSRHSTLRHPYSASKHIVSIAGQSGVSEISALQKYSLKTSFNKAKIDLNATAPSACSTK
jgi:hypothetical protein